MRLQQIDLHSIIEEGKSSQIKIIEEGKYIREMFTPHTLLKKR